MKKTLFLMLTIIVALGLTTNDTCFAKKTAESPVAALITQTKERPDTETAQVNCSECCDDTQCSSQYSSQCLSWFDRVKAWFTGFFGTKTSKNDVLKKASHVSQRSNKNTDDDSCAKGNVCSENEAVAFAE